jgi:hypothetical protein
MPTTSLSDEVKQLFDSYSHVLSRVNGIEEKGIVRHVRTAAGVARFNRPIGAVIIARGPGDKEGTQLVNLWSTGKHSADGYEIYEGADNSTLPPPPPKPGSKPKVVKNKPAHYFVGKDVSGDQWHVYDEHEAFIGSYGSELDALVELDKHIAEKAPGRTSRGNKPRSSTRKYTSPRGQRGQRTPPPGMHKATGKELLQYSKTGKGKNGEETVSGAAVAKLVDIFIFDDLEGKATIGYGYDRFDNNQRPATFLLRGGQESNQAAKFAIVNRMQKKMPSFDKKIAEDSKTDDTARALVLMRRLGLRVDTEAGTGTSYGATSLQAEHVAMVKEGGKPAVHFQFKAKNGDLDFVTTDPEVVRVIRDAKKGKKPTDRLFPDASDEKTKTVLRDHFGDLGNRPNHTLRAYYATERARAAVKAAMGRGNKKKLTKAEFDKAVDGIIEDIADNVLFDKKQQVLTYVDPATFAPLAFKPEWAADMIEQHNRSLGREVGE